MPAPTTIDEFLELVRKSGVVEEKRLTTHLAKLRAASSPPSEPKQYAEMMVGDGIITLFQAQQFLLGKWRRFTLGKYKVLERLGTGGMGSVYLCEHMLMRRRVAVKVLPTAKAEDPAALERFYREARAVAALDHPNIVRAYDIDHDENLHFLVMEHVDGSSLQEIIKHRSGPMDVLRAAHYMRQAALGLQHAHETATLVHRDIKPGNILVDRNGIVKILDMGLARFFHDEEDVLTKKYDENVLGTADYLAPEQALDSHGVDIRADLYSLGATFYFCLIGRTPFAEGTVAQKLIWHQTRAPKPLRSFRPEVPEGIVAIIDRMMAKDVAKRFQTPLEVADALAPWTQTPIPPPPDSEMPQFSLAATRGLNETAPPSNASRPPSDAPSGSRNKVWQVSGAPSAQSTATASLTPPNSRPPGAETPKRESRPAATPSPSPAPARNSTAPAKVLRTPDVAPASPSPAPIAAIGPAVSSPTSATSPTANGRIRTNLPDATSFEMPEAIEEPVNETDEATFVDVGSPRTPRSVRRKAIIRETKPLKFWVAVGTSGTVGLILLIWLIYLVSRPSGGGKPESSHDLTIRVNSTTPGGLAGAVRRAKRGTRIVIEGDLDECNVWIPAEKSHLTIEAEPNSLVALRCPETMKAKDDPKLIVLQSATNVTIKGLILDGRGIAKELVVLSWKCSGSRLENLRLRNYTRCGMLINNCEGEAGHPVLIRNLEFENKPSTFAIRFNILPNQLIRLNRFITFDKCRFEGSGKRMVTENDNYVELDTVKLPQGEKLEIVPSDG